MTRIDEHELRRRFAQLRDADQTHAPGFALVCQRSPARRDAQVRPSMRPLAIGAVAVIAIIAIWLVRAPANSAPMTTPLISTWRAPTDGLLQTHGSEVLSTIPDLGASMLDHMLPTS